MGAGIAQAVAAAGFPVVLKDVDPAAVERALTAARAGLARNRRLTPDELAVKCEMLSGTTAYDPFAGVDIAIEAVPEELDLKSRVFRELRAAAPAALLATNTSALSVTAMGADVGLHFFHPAAVMKLVEVIPAARTPADTLETATAFVESIHKVPIRVKECPGFLVNRILGAYLHEAIRMVEEGASPQSVDAACVDYGFPIGPLQLADASGIAVCHHAGRAMGRESKFLERLHREKRGFYPCEPGPAVSWERPVAALKAEARRCLADGVAPAADIGRAMQLGTGYPLEKRGPLC